MASSTPINRALGLIPKRAEQQADTELRSTFEDSGVVQSLESIDNQIVYGRRGTGKTHALRYLATTLAGEENIAVYVDLRTVGSPEGLYEGAEIGPVQRTARLLVDLLTSVHDSIFAAAVEDEGLGSDSNFVASLDGLLASISTIRLDGEVETTSHQENSTSNVGKFSLGLGSKRGIEADVAAESGDRHQRQVTETRKGGEKLAINFTDVARALRALADSLSVHRIWILLDEWTSVPPKVQPYLAAFLTRCVLPLQSFTVKITAIEQQAVFRTVADDGTVVGFEVGADITANLSLDDFMVFEQEEDRAREFFLRLFYKHLTSGKFSSTVNELHGETDLITHGFTDTRAFDELVRAAEGVPRDAINIAAIAARRANDGRISIPHVRTAARQWYQGDKERAVRDLPGALDLLNWVIDKVIRDKKARGFLVNQRDSGADSLQALFGARVLHLVRRGYSAQDAPGERFDVYVIDYGAYVDLISTKNAPLGVLPIYGEGDELTGDYVDVPSQDLRALRRAVLDLKEFKGE
ncbi:MULTISPECIES: hypothetical protein [unclassified Pseudoclavibacter]|uniref:ORC-CDC6 family AAA ATPase n=1 Tax=unclassified Pseudoclavibacter TaxID=2615177 RepID=UPI001BA52077|nr:hypothetical protein [Pseudoclavibacter sp. Marseille-Q4354]MBS3177214.1 hypothetical protein [Pseudoclavibacter sp. Marseille-Q4354]